MCRSRVWIYCASFLVCLCCSCILVQADEQLMTDPVEVKALHAIKKSLVDPNKNLRDWKGDPCISNWTGIHCYNTTLNDGYLHVEELQLLKLNLSGSLSPELGHLPHLVILDVMWNSIGGSIPKEIGNITSLKLLLLNGNLLEGPLPEELGNLPNLDRLQIDQNKISGPIPKSFAKLIKAKHFHMNNNSISGQIPPELSELPNLIHLLLDNNNMSGYLPSEFSSMPSLHILQLDNNRFDGTIPDSYSNMSKLLKLSLRNCSLQGPIPDLSKIPNLYYLDLSLNELTGPIPKGKFSANITTIDLSENKLNGTIPSNFSGLPNLQKLSFANNTLTGSVPSAIWSNITLNETETLDLDFRNNELFNISGSMILPPNVSLWLGGNPVCSTANMIRFCGNRSDGVVNTRNSSDNTCRPQSCPSPFEYSPTSPVPCFCAAPLLIGYRLKSPGFSNFLPYKSSFIEHLTYGLGLEYYQMDINSFVWVKGPRLQMYLKLFPIFREGTNDSHIFNKSEVLRIQRLFSRWTLPDSDLFGPYELLNFTLLEPYMDVIPTSSTSGLSKGALAGIVLGAIAVAVTLSAVVSLLIMGVRVKDYRALSRKHRLSKSSIKIDGVKAFSYKELASATNNFDVSIQVGQGGYGKVYKGILAGGFFTGRKRVPYGDTIAIKVAPSQSCILNRIL